MTKVLVYKENPKNLFDCWDKDEKNNINGLTWSKNDNIPQSRINYVFMTRNMLFSSDGIFLRRAPNVEKIRYSDNIGLRFDINTTENLRRNGYWELNIFHSLDKTFCDEIRKKKMWNRITLILF